jgi:hypothetical protein
MRIANHPIDNGHRVLQVTGTISPGFRWYEADRTDDPIEILKSEGIEFDEQGRANPAQRFSMDDFANLLGEEFEDVPGALHIPAGQDETLRESFVEQLTEGTAVLSLISIWSVLGGTIKYGTAAQTSCFLMLRAAGPDSIWPLAIYPTGQIEVVFQYLSTRSPFDDIQVRNEFRELLNQIPGVDLPRAKLALRPSIRAESLASETSLERARHALAWFVERTFQTEGDANEEIGPN